MIQQFPDKNIVPNQLRNEKGFALITVLVLSAVLMATMAIVMNSATMEVVMSGASSVSKMALARADAGIEYVRGSFDLVSYNDPLNPFNSPYVAAGNPYLPISNVYINTQSANSGVPSTVMDSTNTGFSLEVSRETNNALLTGRGFSIGQKNAGMTLSAYPCRVTSTGTVGLYSKTVAVEGFTLAP
ncbi:MAG: pilus assembly PilX N-terminal domain-containing protein [Geobacteraceae bacterium]|nr:pilus assembly PilX N-terminal domain-containing protein [Geobacteraceae bacterium]